MAISITSQTIQLDGVQSILVSDIQPDSNSTAFVRRIDFFTDPADTINRIPVLTVWCFGGNQTGNEQIELEIQTPRLQF